MAPQIIKDPTLPPGWEALYDDTQRVTYYWNKTTNVTTYDKPAGGPAPMVRRPRNPPSPRICDLAYWYIGNSCSSLVRDDAAL